MGGPTLNLFVIAAGNTEALEVALQERLTDASSKDADILARYTERVRHTGRISINMVPEVLRGFLDAREHRNIYERASAKAKDSRTAREEILRKELDTYYERRIAFEGSFEDGERFRYGALNIGGLGASTFGLFCVVCKDHVSSTLPEVAYLRADSLETYLLPGPVVDEAKIRRDASPHSHRQCLAALKHADEVPRLDELQWPALLCSGVDYVEAIFTAQLTPEDVQVIRMSRTEHNRLLSDHVIEASRAMPSGDQLRLGGALKQILEDLKQNQIRLVDETDIPMEDENAPSLGVGS